MRSVRLIRGRHNPVTQNRYQNHQKAHGFSKWLILERDSGIAIGESGLLVLPEYGWVDLGFRFAQPHWGKGLATEVASAWVREALDEFRVGQLGAFAHPKTSLQFAPLKRSDSTPNEEIRSGAWTQLCFFSMQSS